MLCQCASSLDTRVIVHDQKLYCDRCGYPLPDNDRKQNADGRKIINGWVTFPSVNRAGF
jgi:hypothetical protein